uniref:Uncharacterized protein n=1 Tax=Heterorhabditis bacteriophora TaxID=37862 RepID=A0A1I7XRF3_HETBA
MSKTVRQAMLDGGFACSSIAFSSVVTVLDCYSVYWHSLRLQRGIMSYREGNRRMQMNTGDGISV